MNTFGEFRVTSRTKCPWRIVLIPGRVVNPMWRFSTPSILRSPGFSKPIFHFRVSHPHFSLLWPKLLIKRHIGKWKQLHYDQLSLLNNSVAYNVYYCPQCSCHKVMFLHISVILFTEGKCLAVTPSPRQTPPGQTPPGQTPPGQSMALIKSISLCVVWK